MQSNEKSLNTKKNLFKILLYLDILKTLYSSQLKEKYDNGTLFKIVR